MEEPDHPHHNFGHHLDGRPRGSHHISSASSTVSNLSSTLALSAPLILQCINHLDSGPKTPVPSWKLYQNPFYTGINSNDAAPALSKHKLAHAKSSERLTNIDRDHYPCKQSAHEHSAHQQKYDNYARGYGIHGGDDARAAQQCHYNRPYAIPSLISARKLAALLWEHYDTTTTTPSLDQQPDHEPSDQCMVEDASTVRDGCDEQQLVIDGNKAHAEKPALSDSLRNELPTAGSKKVSSPALEKIGENKMHDVMSSDQAASTGAALATILQRLKCVEENQMKSMALLRTLRLEVEDTSARLQDLEYSHKAALSEINAALQHYGEQLAAMSRRKEQEKIRAAFWHLREEMENEKEACRLLRIQNKKLGKELEQASSAAATACEELERERKARELMEDVCDELAREIGQDKAEVEQLKREQVLVKERVEEERKMLRMASLWREERGRPKAQMGINDTNEENHLALQDLKRKLEAFVATVGSACEGSREDLERQVEQAKKLREALDSLQETVEIEEEEPAEVDRGDQTHMDQEEELRETEDGDTELGHYRLESAHDLSRHGLSCSSIEKFGSLMCKSPQFEDRVRKERPGWTNRTQYSTRKVRLRRGANGKLCRVRSQDLFDGSSSTREQQSDTQCEDTHVYDEQNLELLAFDKHSSDTSGREDHHKLSTGGENVSTETNYLKGQETNDEAQLSQEDNHRSFSDQEADHGCCLDSDYHVGKGHRKQLSLQYVDSTGKISMGRNTVDDQHTDLHHTRAQKDGYAGAYMKNGRKSEEDEEKAERGCMKTKGHCWDQQDHSSSAARNHREGDNNNKIDDQDSDEWEDFYFEPVRAPAAAPPAQPAQNADSSQLITQNSTQAESQRQNDIGIIDSPRSAGHINATLLACPRNDKQSMSSSKPAMPNKDNSSQSSCHSPRVQKHNIPSKHSQEPKPMSKSAYSTPAMSPPLQKSSQSSSMRPLQSFWSPASPTNYAAIFGTAAKSAAGSSSKHHSHHATCELVESRLIPALPHHHHQNTYHEAAQAAQANSAILHQDIQQKAIQQPAAGQSLVKSNSLRAQLMKARQIEGNEGITTHKSAFAGRFRFSPLRSRPPSTAP